MCDRVFRLFRRLGVLSFSCAGFDSRLIVCSDALFAFALHLLVLGYEDFTITTALSFAFAFTEIPQAHSLCLVLWDYCMKRVVFCFCF